MKQPSEDTICGQPIVYDRDIPEGEVHMNPFTMALIEARSPTITVIQATDKKKFIATCLQVKP